MKLVFKEVNSLDEKCYRTYYLNKEILMENAAYSIKKHIDNYNGDKKKILIVCGKGDNGADGITLARMLYLDYDVKLYLAHKLESDISLLQLKRANALGLKTACEIMDSDIIVDCLYGSGLKGKLNKDIELIKKINSIKAYKIACDIPSGISSDGSISDEVFKANITITMGALKLSLFGDKAKDFIGEIEVSNLGISNKAYEDKSDIYLLEESDLLLPTRNTQNSHKYSYGHSMILSGELFGAGLLSAKASLSFGCGAVSILKNKDILKYDESIMYKNDIPSNISAIVFGMGLGKYKDSYIDMVLKMDKPLVIDADMFYEKRILEFLTRSNIVLTPHPKEFISLLKISNIADIGVDELQENRYLWVEKFMQKYSNVCLLLKGANSIIAYKDKMYINTTGSSKLSKAGSGDVLSGLIVSLLSQGYSTIKSAINSSLAHSLASKKVPKNNYALNPNDIIKEIDNL